MKVETLIHNHDNASGNIDKEIPIKRKKKKKYIDKEINYHHGINDHY